MRVLTFRSGRARYALDLEDVAEVARAGDVRPVPLAPAGFRGLAERRGRLVAVVDGPRALADGSEAAPAPDPGGAYVVRLRSPHDGAALWLPFRLTTAQGTPEPGGSLPPGTRGRVVVDGEPHLLLDVRALVSSVL